MKFVSNYQIRKQIPITKKGIYLNNSGAGPLCASAIRAIREATEQQVNFGGNLWEVWMEKLASTRKLFAKLISAEQGEICYIPNVTCGLWVLIPALLLGIRNSSNVVSTDMEFPNMVQSWHLQKKIGKINELRIIKSSYGSIELNEYEKAIDDNTAIVAVHYTSYMNGHKQDLRKICDIAHDHGAIVIGDAYQSAGLIPIDVKKDHVDVLLTGSHKWILGPTGIGFMYVNKELLAKVNPSVIGWFGVKREERFDLSRVVPSNDASRFESGSYPVLSGYGAEAALGFVLRNNFTKRFEYVRDFLGEKIVEGCNDLNLKILSPLEKSKRSGIISVRVPNAERICEKLQRKRIYLSTHTVASQGVGMRIAPHVYNTADEIEGFFTGLKRILNC